MGFNIAIDGPAGAGKSTVSKAAAKELNFVYVDTGAMYRAIGLYLIRNGIDSRDPEAVVKALPGIRVSIQYIQGIQRILLNDLDVTDHIRTQEVGEAASRSSAYPDVRAHLLNLQRKIAAEQDVLMDGRDIGTCILPRADLKIYLTADSRVRAKRRFDELKGKGEDPVFEDILREIEERDYRDMHRETAPLRQAEDAVLLDSSYMTAEEVTEKIVKLAREKQNAGKSC